MNYKICPKCGELTLEYNRYLKSCLCCNCGYIESQDLQKTINLLNDDIKQKIKIIDKYQEDEYDLVCNDNGEPILSIDEIKEIIKPYKKFKEKTIEKENNKNCYLIEIPPDEDGCETGWRCSKCNNIFFSYSRILDLKNYNYCFKCGNKVVDIEFKYNGNL